MAPKRNAFYMFMVHYKNEEIKKGNILPSLSELAKQLTPVWDSLSDDEKNYYKRLADEFNQKKVETPILLDGLKKNTSDYWKMQQYLAKLFESIPDKTQLFKQKFILLHVNCHSHDGEQYYFPAEIAALEFCLLKGVTRTYHQIVGLSKIYPRGFAGGLRQHSDKFHQISCWDEHPDDYKKILMDLLSFLRSGKDISTDLNEGTLDLPYMYTLETQIGSDMMKTISSLERLYKTAFPEHSSEHKSLFKIGSVERLLNELNKTMNVHLHNPSVGQGKNVHDILESDLYGFGLGCVYHEMRDIAYKCSKARILQWMSNICKHVSRFTSLELIPGRHLAVQLRDGSRMIVQNDDIPLTKRDLRIIDV